MTRRSLLVVYSSSDDEDGQGLLLTSKKRCVFIYHSTSVYSIPSRKLPSLSASIVPSPLVDNPSLHQGRIRTVPHVDGQFSAHVYLSLSIEPRTRIHQLVSDVLGCAREMAPTLQSSFYCAADTERAELHISLSRPTFLRSHQREDFKRAIQALAKKHSPCVIFLY
jgi:U6 snRNA phosphodiesterase